MVKKKEPTHEEETQVGLEIDAEEEEAEETKDVAAPAGELADEAVAMSADIPVRLLAVMGEKRVNLKNLLQMKIGQSVDFNRPPNEFVDLIANGKLVAKGELVDIDGKLGVRIIKMVR